MSSQPEPRAAASLAGVRIERVFIDDEESRHLTRDDIDHFREALTVTAPEIRPYEMTRGGLDTAGIAGLLTLCVVAFGAVLFM